MDKNGWFGYSYGRALTAAAIAMTRPPEVPTMTTDQCILMCWCPRCEAGPGEICRDTGRGFVVAHPERVAIAAAWEARHKDHEWLKAALRRVAARQRGAGR